MQFITLMECLMKKFGLIFLSLMFIFMVSCSGDNPHNSVFLKKVAGKNTGNKSNDNGVFFNESGRICEVLSTNPSVKSGQYYFKEAKSNSEAIYTLKLNSDTKAIFTIIDENLSISIDGAKNEQGSLKI